jgi:electron transport complex protein RnfE
MSLIKQDDSISLDTFLEGVWRENPVFVMMLGMCPTLAVTTSAVNALGMGVATTFVLIASSLLVSIFRNLIPAGVRIATYIVIISTFVTLVDYIMQAYSQTLYHALGAFIQLIVVNCIILGRAEACASRNKPLKSMVNAAGMGVGFTLALLCLGGVREILGSGSLFGLHLFGEHFQPWVIMVLPAGGFLVLAGWLMLFEWLKIRKQNQTLKVGGVAHEH